MFNAPPFSHELETRFNGSPALLNVSIPTCSETVTSTDVTNPMRNEWSEKEATIFLAVIRYIE